MRKTLLMMALAAAASMNAAQARSIWDGVYTEAQADRGHTQYMQNCSRCHGVNLWGTYEIPSLMGRSMHYYSGSNLDAFLDYISTAMPLGRPGSLSPSANAEIMAYILKMNGVPSGNADLTAQAAGKISFDSVRPKSKGK